MTTKNLIVDMVQLIYLNAINRKWWGQELLLSASKLYTNCAKQNGPSTEQQAIKV